MSQPSARDIWEALDRTWPAASTRCAGGFLVREGAGGGKRVSAASLDGTLERTDFKEAERAFASLGQPPLFMVRGADTALDCALAEERYTIVDPVAIYAAPVDRLKKPLPAASVFSGWEPLAIQRDIWEAGGIDAPRIAVMERAIGPKTTFLGRVNNRPIGAAFAALSGQVAMLHALEVMRHARRLGVGRSIMHAAANWSARHGATYLIIAVTKANVAANGLYSSMGMHVVEQYHYRIRGGGAA